MRFFYLLLTIGMSLCLNAQIEIPQTNIDCKVYQRNGFSYCLDSTFATRWTATCIKGSTIENKEYLPTDGEFFKNMPPTVKYAWQKIEMQSRMWAMEFDSVYVVTGEKTFVIDSSEKKAYYKAILKGCQGDALGFLVIEEDLKSSLKAYALTINELEQKTNIDFFPTLNKDLQEIFEAEFNWEFWPVIVD